MWEKIDKISQSKKHPGSLLSHCILEDELAQKIDFYGLNPREVIFQHDNCPIHKAKTAAEYLQNREYQVLE